MEKEKMNIKLEKVKPKPSKGIKIKESEIIGTSKGTTVREIETDVADTTLNLAPPGLQVSSSKKAVKKEEERAVIDNFTPIKGKEGKMKRGGCTEKQLLREKIREMLIDAGWTIDYRPRRNRDYLDAVYINPSGTAYWSIIKAYDALKKQLEEDKSKSQLVIDSPSFAPLSEDLINKLTRQTKMKVEEAMKRNRKEDGLSKSAKRSPGRDDGESSDSDQNEETLSSCRKHNQKLQRRTFPDTDQASDGELMLACELSNDSLKSKSRKIKVDINTSASNCNVLQGRTSKVIGRCTLLVRHSVKGENSEFDGYVPYSGKRTILAWLIDSGTAQLSEKVQYMNRKRNRAMLEGWVTRDGIHCGCCSKILTVSKFELHAGSKLRQPFQNIFLESGPSLLQCQVDAWNKQGGSVCRDFHTVAIDGDNPDDDACGICGDGGALICCDSCQSTFHQTCLDIQMLPSGDWHCPNCICKFCGEVDADELTRCSFCVDKYHKSCSKGVLASSMSLNGASFCGLQCQEFYDHLQKILGVKHELEGGFSWSLIQRTDVSDTSHRGFPQRVESNSKIAVALSVMNECFLPIIDRRSGINMMCNVVYNIGSNFNRLNFCGFYTIILERGDEIVSAASLRIHGTRLAEMPFIGSREIYRRQGMCRRLLSAIETELRYLKVKQLVIPAISEHTNTWTSVFGFHQLEDGLKKEIKSMTMLVFPGTDMLHKPLAKHSDGMKVSESIKNQSQMPVMVEKSDIDSPMEYEKQTSNDSGVGHGTKTNDQFSDLDSGYPAPADHTSTPDSIYEPLTCNGAIVIKSEVEDNQKELSASSTACECENIELQNGLQGPPQEDNSPLEAILCKTEAPCLKSICDSATETDLVETVTSRKDTAESTSVNIGSSVKVSEETDAEALVNHVSVLEASSPSATNGDMEVFTNSAATSDFKIDKDECDGEASCINRSPQVSAKDVSEEVDLNHNPTPMSTLLDSGRNACKADIQVQNDLVVSCPAPETALVVDGEAASLSSSGSLVEATAPTESKEESNAADGENNR
ncbi:increased DNA methylation 1-like [Salvia splendens]|nr:increased DNA methylation 1-like [Salvia splendens]